MKRIITTTKAPIKIWATDLEQEAENQVVNVANLPFIHSHVAVMPDAHGGKGSTIGSVIATKGAVLPAAVGVDLGCGMAAIKLPFKIDLLGDLKQLRHSIERSVPTGFNNNKSLTETANALIQELGPPPSLDQDHALFKRSIYQIGTLGGGNHFIEICSDKENNAWLMLHSGSRNIGKELADKHINNAKDVMRKMFIELPDPDLAYIAEDTPDFKSYIGDMLWAQRYARANRNEMVNRVLKDISLHVFKDARLLQDASLFRVDCHHNFCQKEHHFGANVWVTRKGAVSAKSGEYGIIPGSMGTKSYVVRGLGNKNSFESCSHGAGRRMSRTKARELFSNKDLEQQTEGVECRKDSGVVDEIPAAYKDIDVVMDNQKDLVEIVHELKQLICVKG